MKTVNVKEGEDYIYQRTICECGDSSCDLHITLETDKSGYTSIILEGKFRTFARYNINHPRFLTFFEKIWWRLKTSMKILVTGRIELDYDILLDKKAAIEFQEALKENTDKLNSQKNLN